MSSSFYPPASFAFRLSLEGDSGTFQEVAGLPLATDTESSGESSGNSFAHRLPGPSHPPTLLLMRGTLKTGGPLSAWCGDSMSASLSFQVEVKTLILELVEVSAAATVLKKWVVSRAWPLKWDLVAITSPDTDVAIEELEIAHQGIELL